MRGEGRYKCTSSVKVYIFAKCNIFSYDTLGLTLDFANCIRTNEVGKNITEFIKIKF